MREILADANRWAASGEPIAVATVVQTWGSAPRGIGAKMAMTAKGQLSGSVSGGCVEGAVYAEGEDVLRTGTPKLLHFGVADETAWDVGLACGGTIEVFVERLVPEVLAFWNQAALSEMSTVTATVLSSTAEQAGGKLLTNELDEQLFYKLNGSVELAAHSARAMMRGQSERIKFMPATAVGEVMDVFIDVQLPSPVLVMIGAGHIAIALDLLARGIGFQTVVIDPRGAFATRERLAHAGLLFEEWPDTALKKITISRGTALAVLTHDPKIDDPALLFALNSRAFYIGALGSDKTHKQRVGRLTKAGATQDKISRIFAPIGLEIGARSPEEIALAILAQIVKERNTSIN